MSETREALAPCPFCGGTAQTEHLEGKLGRWRWSVGCNDHKPEADDGGEPVAECYGFQSMTSFATKAEAIAAWNRRALSARDERGEERGWMPIETAPEDGRLILVFDQRNEPAQTVEMRKADGGFWRWMISQKCATPTHWRELPAPPAAIRAGGTDGH